MKKTTLALAVSAAAVAVTAGCAALQPMPSSHSIDGVSPAFSLIFTGFHSFVFCPALVFGPYFQVLGSIAPVLTAPGSGFSFAPLFVPAGAASGNFCLPASGLLAYGSADAGFWPPAGA